MPLNQTQTALLNFLEDTTVPKKISSVGATALTEFAKKFKLQSTVSRSVIASIQENPENVRKCWCFDTCLFDGSYSVVINVNPNAEPSPKSTPKSRSVEPIIAKYTPWGEFSSPAVGLAAVSVALGEGGEADFAIVARNTCQFYGLDEKATMSAVEVARKNLNDSKIYVPQIAKSLAEKNVFKIHAETFHNAIEEALEERTKSRERQIQAEAKKRKREAEKEEREAKKQRPSEPPVSQDAYLGLVEEAITLWNDKCPLTTRHYRAVNLSMQSFKLAGIPMENVAPSLKAIAADWERAQREVVSVTANQISQVVEEHHKQTEQSDE